MPNQRQIREAGVASMIVTLIIMIITSLIVLGFAQSARRNQREALDRHVSAQAYYAAETGVNDAVTAIKQQLALPAATVYEKPDCLSGPSTYAAMTTKAVLDPGTAYTCVTVNPSPTSLLYTLVSQGKSTVVPLNTAVQMGSLTISWKASGSVNRNPAACNNINDNLPRVTQWNCDYSMMRLDLTKYSSDLSASTLTNNTVTFYLKPNASAINGDVSVASLSDPKPRAAVNTVRCVQATSTCSATIRFTADFQSKYFMRMTSMYRDAGQVTISATDTTNVAQRLSGAQAVIDSTGKSQDQLRRISVRLPLQATNNSEEYPLNALQTANGICKRFNIGEFLAATPANLCQP